MNYILTILFGILFTNNVQAQSNDAPYLKDKKTPIFSIMSVKGKEVTEKKLPSNYKYTCFIIFSPDCSHCQTEAEDINQNMAKLKNMFFVWASYREMADIKKFAAKYKLNQHANVVVGQDPTFTLPSFFRPKMTPFVAIYKNGRLLKVYEQGAKVSELVDIIESK